jgi:tRNA nucleotidyltransferase (CCA-adding enzyme)
MFAALCHDLGKPLTTITNDQGKVCSPKHSVAGVQPSLAFLQRIGAPQWLSTYIQPLVKEHVTHLSGDATLRAVKRLAKRLEPSSIEMWEMLTEADACGRHPAPPCRPALSWLKLAEEVSVKREKEAPIVTGKLLIQWGVKPSPAMGKLLDKAYEAQLDGLFNNESTAKTWYKKTMH